VAAAADDDINYDRYYDKYDAFDSDVDLASA